MCTIIKIKDKTRIITASKLYDTKIINGAITQY